MSDIRSLGFVVLVLAIACSPKRVPIADLTAACQGGALEACQNLAVRLQLGQDDDPKDPKRAREAHEKACGEGHMSSACADLGAMLEGGVGGPKDLVQARLLFVSSCGAGDDVGCVLLGRLFARGHGVDHDPKKARSLFAEPCELARQGPSSGWACASLADLIRTESPGDAEKLSRKGCSLGNQLGCLQVAEWHERSSDPTLHEMGVRLKAEYCAKGVADACKITRVPFGYRGGADRVLVAELTYQGSTQLSAEELAKLTDTKAGTVNASGMPLDVQALDTTIRRIKAFYYDRGFINFSLLVWNQPADDRAHLVFRLREGEIYRLGRVAVGGVDEAAEFEALIGLSVGEVYNRSRVGAALARFSAREYRITPCIHVDTERRVIDIRFVFVRRLANGEFPKEDARICE